MTLTERIKDRRQDDLTPIVERRQPEWVRRAQERFEKIGYVAVADLTPKPRRAA